jgi:DNA-binding response OmpR family regulator
MPEPQILDVDALIATEDKSVLKQVERLFPHLRKTGKPGELEKKIEEHLQGASEKEHDLGFLVLLDLDMPSLNGASIVKLLKAAAEPVHVLIMKSQADEELRDTLEAGSSEYLDYLVKPFDPADLFTRTRKLLREPQGPPMPPMDPPILHLVEKLHEPDGGLLNARNVADFFGVTLADLARLLGRGVSTVHKTPSSSSIQDGLRPFETIASAILRLTGSERRARMWLHAANPALQEHAPIELIRRGRVAELGSFVQDLLEGRPA